MVNLEQVRLLETKVAKAIDYVKRLSEENTLLRGKLDGYKNRIDELEVLVQRFKEDQGNIEAGIISALERLNQFEDVMDLDTVQMHSEDSEASDESVSETAESPSPSAQDLNEADSDEAILAGLEAEEAALKNNLSQDSSEAASSADVKKKETEDTSGNIELDIF